MPKIFSLVIIAALLLAADTARAQTPAELQNQISTYQAEIKKLEAEIATYQKEIEIKQKTAGSLKSEIGKLELMKKQLADQIAVTQKKIAAAEASLKRLGTEIAVTRRDIDKHRTELVEALRVFDRLERENLGVRLFVGWKLSESLSELQRFRELQTKIQINLNDLHHLTQTLEVKQTATAQEKSNLAVLTNRLADQRKIAEQNQATKNKLLTDTKNQELSYQKLLAERLERKRRVEAEIAGLEANLKTHIDKSRLPLAGTVILSWPLQKIIITQYFGQTEFAMRNPIIYRGLGHNGIDLGAPVGTAILAPADGLVSGSGDTDPTCRGASYGRWILIAHPNLNISTVYAHLSLAKVQAGQRVSRGETIGYVGQTGYATGPHLHFGVVATEGVQISTYQSKVPGCGVYTMPLASHESYLNPLSYLPPL